MSWAKVILKFSLHVAALRKLPGLPSVNQIIPRCVHTGWDGSAANIKSSRTRICVTHLGISSRKPELQ